LKKSTLEHLKLSFKIVDFPDRGKGLIVEDTILPGTIVGTYLSKDLKPIVEGRVCYDNWIESIPLGRYINHNRIPNCNVTLDGNTISLVSNNVIDYNEEITVNYIEVAELIKVPKDQYDKYGIKDFDYTPVKNVSIKPTLF
jgi:hypothetical protein